MKWTPIICLLFSLNGLFAQYEGVIFNADYTFAEGVYLSHASWIANQPDFTWEEIEGEMVQLPEDYRVQIDRMRLKNGAPLPEVYAISLDGFPYMFTRQHEKLGYHEFAGLRFRGRYAYYRFAEKQSVTTTMYAYNPLNGRPFRQAPVTREKDVMMEVLLHVQSGRTQIMNRVNVYELLHEHSDLRRAVSLLSDKDPELRQKLIQAVKLFNEREPLLLQRVQ